MTYTSTTPPEARPKKGPVKLAAGVLTATMLVTLVPVTGANAAETSYVTSSTLLNDSMTRAKTNSWGTASNNVNYTGFNSALGVAGGTAKMDLNRPGKSMKTEAQVKSTNAEASYQFSIDKLPTSGSGVYSSLHLRQSDSGFYRSVVQVTPAGKTYLELSRANNEKITVLKKTELPLKVRAGEKINLELRATGTNPVKLQTKVWAVGTAKPSVWNLSVDDKSAARISNAGNLAVTGYLSGVSQVSTLRYDNLKLTALKPEVAKPAPTKPAVPAPVKPAPTTAPPVTTPPATAGYREGWGEPVFRDEFTSGLGKWNVRDNDSLSYDKARIKAANVKVSDGLLHIEGKRQTVDGRDFTSGYIDSIGKFEQQYGRWEIRAKIPTTPGDSRGIWPAFWLRNSGVGEVDIMEAWGDPFDEPTKIGTSYFTAHESTNGGGQKTSWNWENKAGTTVNSSEGFHTWAIEYTPTELKGYFDDKLVMTTTKAENPWLWGANFQSKFNMRLNLQIGSNYHGHPIGPDYKDTKSYSDFQIDYVRAWGYKGK